MEAEFNPSPTYPKRRADLSITPIEIGGIEYFTVMDPRNGQFYRLGAPAAWLLERLDGETAPGELAAAFNFKFEQKLTNVDIETFVHELTRMNLTEKSPADSSEQTDTSGSSDADGREETRRPIRLTEIYLGQLNPEELINRLEKIYRPFHNWFGFSLALVIGVPGLAIFFSNLSAFSLSLDLLSKATSIFTLLAATFVMISIHELAHAVLLRYFGGSVTRMGFMLLFFQPCFYCDVSEAWNLKLTRQRVAVSAAGLIAQLLILSMAAIIWRMTETSSFIHQFALATVVVSWINFFFNFIPFIKLDGYYMLMDIWGIPNLREKALTRVMQPVRRFLGLSERVQQVTPSQSRRLFWFGLGTILYTTVLLIATIWFFGLLSNRWFGVAGVLLYSVLVAAILAPSIWRTGKSARSFLNDMTKEKKKQIGLIRSAIIFLPLLGLFLFYPLPHTAGGNVSLRAHRTFEIRLTDAGLLEREEQNGGAHPSRQTSFLQPATNDIASLTLVPMVADGEVVAVGDTLAIFASNEVTRQLDEAQAELARLQSELTLLKAPPKKERVAEIQAQVEAAKADLTQKRRDLARAESLSVRQLLPVSQLESSRTAVTMAEAILRNRESTFRLVASPPRPEEESVLVNEIDKQNARLMFLRTQIEAQLIISPIRGTALVNRDGSRVLSIHSTDTMEVSIPVADIDLPLVWLDQTARVKVRSHADTVFSGQIVRVPVIAQNDSLRGNFLVAALLPNESGMLREGMAGYGKIGIGKRSAASLLWRKLMSVTRVEFWGLW